jgi:hypothetical protein
MRGSGRLDEQAALDSNRHVPEERIIIDLHDFLLK